MKIGPLVLQHITQEMPDPPLYNERCGKLHMWIFGYVQSTFSVYLTAVEAFSRCSQHVTFIPCKTVEISRLAYCHFIYVFEEIL